MGIEKNMQDFSTYVMRKFGESVLFNNHKPFKQNHAELFDAWLEAKASAVPEGFVLMPIKPSEGMIVAVRKCHEGEAYLPHSLYSEFVNQARIEAQEIS